MRAKRTTIAAALGLILPLSSLMAGPAHAAKPPCPADAGDGKAASAAARACGARVEVLSLRTETGQVFANPDGTATVEEYAYPQRARKGGGWTSLDPTLELRADGKVAPRASTLDIVFSGGGDSPLVSSLDPAHRINLSWPGALPKPVLSGNTATYAEVLAGVDLVITAQDTGFSEVLVVKTRQAGANPALRRIAFGADRATQSQLTASAPMAWDSSTDSVRGGRARGDVHGPAAGAKVAPMSVSTVDTQMVLTPALLDDASTTYPVFLDPTITTSTWTMINSQFPSQSYWSYDKNDCPSNYAASVQCAKVGQIVGGTMDYRSIWQFSTSEIHGKHVLVGGTKFAIDLLHSSCSNGAGTTQLHTTGSISSSTNWSNHSGTWSGMIASVSNSSCSSQRLGTEISGGSLVTTLQSIADGSATTMSWGLRGASESSDKDWKKFDASTAKMIVSINTVPNTPDGVTIDGKSCATGSGRPYVPSATPTFRAHVLDTEGTALTGAFEWAHVRHDGSAGPVAGTVQQTSVPSNGTALATAPAGVLDSSFSFVAAGDYDRDGYQDVLAQDSVGDMYLLPGAAGGQLQPPVLWGWAYSGYAFGGMADWDRDGYQDVVVKDPAGALWVYPGTGRRNEQSSARFQIGSGGWTPYTLAGVADYDRDGKPDVVARDGSGVLWLYPGNGDRTTMTVPRVQIGTGWATYTFFGVIDWDRDGAPDVIAKGSDGLLWLYTGSGARSPLTGNRYQVGSSWQAYSGLMIPDVTGDGAADFVAVQSGGADWWLYPGSGDHTGHGTRYSYARYGLSDGQVYAVHANASDGTDTSGNSGWCEFGVDTVAPGQPSVTPDIYTAGCGSCGSVGQTGRFTFGSASTDVTTFKWGWASGSLTNSASINTPYVDWTPSAGGPYILFVQAIDKAGNASAVKQHPFYVAAPSNAVARWKLDEPSGTSLTDDTGSGRTATLVSGTLGAPGRIAAGADGQSHTALRMTGSNYATAPSVVDTSKSFTVSAWVKLGDTTTRHAFVVANGSTQSAFYLWYTEAYNRWVFESTTADGGTYSWNTVTSDAAPALNVWTHLTGVFDSAAGTLSLYVNGVKQTMVKTGVTSWNAQNGMYLGRTLGGSNMEGSLAEVQLWNRVVSDTEISDLSNPLKVGKVGEWHFGEAGNPPDYLCSNAYDSSGMAHDLACYSGAAIPASGSGQTGTGLKLGNTAWAATDADPAYQRVLHTDQSFTVSAWLWIDAGTAMNGNRTALAQDGTKESAFFLGYRQVGGVPKWCFALPDTDVDGPTWTSAAATATLTAADQGRWVHLVGVYDASAKTIKLYVDNALVGTTARAVPGWDATGKLNFGAALWTAAGGTPQQADLWQGSIDEVRVYQGAVGNVTLIP